MATAVGALVRRELLRESRRGTHYVSRSLLVGVLALLVVWQLLSVGPRAGGTAQAALARQGTQLFIIWSLMQYFGAIAFSTVGSGALAEERRKGTLPLARMTALGDRGVVFGWFTSVMGRVLFTMALTLPVLVIARSFGGFTLDQLARVVLLTVVVAAYSGALTLAIAALSASAGAAVALSLVVQVLWLMRPALPMFFASLRGFGSSSFWLFVPRQFLWLSSIGVLLDTVNPPSRPLPSSAGFLGALSGGMLLLAGVYLGLAVRFLGAQLPRPGRRLKRLFSAADGFFLRRTGKWGVLWKAGLGPCSGNPVFWRERAASPVGQRDHLIRLAYWMLVPVMVVAALAGSVYPHYWGPLVIIVLGLFLVPLLLIGVLLLAGPATTFARERQEATLPLLAVTPLPARALVWGKYLFGLRLLLVPVAFVAFFLGCYALVLGFAFARSDYALRVALGGLLGRPAGMPLLLVLLPVVAAALLYVGLGATSVGKALGAGLGFLAGMPIALALVAGPALRWGGFLFSVLGSLWAAQGNALAWGFSAALLTASVVLVSRLRWVGNAVVVGLVSGCGWVAAFSLVALYLTPQARPGLFTGFVAIVALVVLSMLLLWRALVHAGPGLANRTGLALIAVTLPYHAVQVVSTSRRFYGGGPYTGYGIDLAVALAAFPVFLAVAAGLTALFLAATTKQLDRFIERHG